MDFENAPWYTSFGVVPKHLTYPDTSMYGCFEKTARERAKQTAYEYMGFKTTYARMSALVDSCAAALVHHGIKKGDRVTICLPNVPQALIFFYAVNRLGAVANMVHPLSAEKEIEFYLNDSGSVLAVTLDQFAEKFLTVKSATSLRTLVVTGPEDCLPAPVRAVYRLKSRPKKVENTVSYRDFMASGKGVTLPAVCTFAKDDAAILYSGGTTGTSKGIMLTNNNFNAVAIQVIATNPMYAPGDKMLAVLPLFHGFGLGVCVHAMMANGGSTILIPRFTLKSYARILARKKPNFIAGVPTMYEALIRLKDVEKLNLSYLKGVYSGGDNMGAELKKTIDAFLTAHHSPVTVREGYGLTECVSVTCLTPYNRHKEGSIGIPMPDTYFKIVEPWTDKELPAGSEGEICLTGPAVMKEYVNQPEETKNALRSHSDGKIWLHTGDLGSMDEDGFLFFHQRLKRMIVTSGYNVYPSQIEKLLDAHDFVHMSCVVGVPDPYRIKKVKAFIVLNPGVADNEGTKKVLDTYIRKHVAKFAAPREYEFLTEMPKTKIGKIDYRKLEEQG